jgi:hypothetical protein
MEMGLRKKSREDGDLAEAEAEAEVDIPREELAEDEAVPDSDIRSDLRELANKKLRHKLGVRKELKNLPALLHENEQVLNMAAGQYDDHQGLLAVTDGRLLFYEKGMVRSRQDDFPYSKISSIQVSTGMMYGELVIFVSGNKAKIKRVLPKERTNEIGDYIRTRIHDAPPAAAAAPPVTAPAASGPAERLRSLQSMLDQGLISAEEFDAKRQEILAEL